MTINNSALALKEALARKVSTAAQNSPVALAEASPQAVAEPACISFNLYLDAKLATGLVQVLQMLAAFATSSAQVKVPVPASPVPSLATCQAAKLPPDTKARGAATTASPASAKTATGNAAAAMTPKQRKLIASLTARKRLCADQVEEILLNLVGRHHSEDLTTREASRVIEHLLSL